MEHQLQGMDLHMHTTCSDGTRTVEEVIEDAYEFGLRHIAITDHNQFAIHAPEDFHGMEIIPGAEFSTAYRTSEGRLLEVHVVGLFFEGVPKNLWRIFHRIPEQRKRYLDAIIAKLNYLGISISYEELMDEFPDSNQLGRRHIAELLIQKGYAESIADAFDRLIGNRSPYWVDATEYMKYMSLETCVHTICENGGFAVLAHPYHYHCPEEEVRKLVQAFCAAAGTYPAGMEVFYSKYDTDQRSELRSIAREYGLFASAASDRHSVSDPFERGEELLLTQMKEAFRLRRRE